MVSTNLHLALRELIESSEEFKEVFPVEIKISASGGGHRIALFADTDTGITIDMCTALSRFISSGLEEKNLVDPENYSIEVSSPGIDKPLILLRQYKKNIGRTLKIVTKTGENLQGILNKVDESQITIANKKKIKNKYELIEKTVEFSDIKTAVVTVSFGGEFESDIFNA